MCLVVVAIMMIHPSRFSFVPLSKRYANIVYATLLLIVSFVMCGVIIQATVYNNINSNCNVFNQFADVIVSNLVDTLDTIKTCPGVIDLIDAELTYLHKYNHTNFRKLVQYIEDQIIYLDSQANDIVDSIITETATIQLSLALIYISMIVIIGCFISTHIVSLVRHGKTGFSALNNLSTFSVFILGGILALVCSGVLAILTLQANLCMAPDTSVIEYWDITQEMLKYYIKCTVDPELPNPLAAELDLLHTISTFIINNAKIINPHCPYVDIALEIQSLRQSLECETVAQASRGLVDNVCDLSFTALTMVYITCTLLFVLIWVLEITKHFNYKRSKL